MADYHSKPLANEMFQKHCLALQSWLHVFNKVVGQIGEFENMGFDLISLYLLSYHFKLGLTVCITWYTHAQLQCDLSIVQMHLFIDWTLIFIYVPFILVICTDPHGTFGCWDTHTCAGQNGCRFYREPSTYIQEHYCNLFRFRVILKDLTGWIN